MRILSFGRAADLEFDLAAAPCVDFEPMVVGWWLTANSPA
jgi:hypothetical protein